LTGVTPTSHDALVRAIFGQPHYAADELRSVLPPIVPLLLHHGTRPWPFAKRFASMLALDQLSRSGVSIIPGAMAPSPAAAPRS